MNRTCLLIAILSCGLISVRVTATVLPSADHQEQSASTSMPRQYLILELWLNKIDQNDAVTVISIGMQYFIPCNALSDRAIALPPSNTMVDNNIQYCRLDEKQTPFIVNNSDQSLQLTIAPTYFKHQNHGATNQKIVKPQPANLGGYFNFDTNTYVTNGSLGARGPNGLFELGVFKGSSLFKTTQLVNSLVGSNHDVMTRTVRLDSVFNIQLPNHMSVFQLGDTYSRAGSTWGNSVHFGGIRWGTDFASQPNFIPWAQPTFKGDATVPSTVDLFINGIKQASQQVEPGAYQVTPTQIVNGTGQATIVSKNILGEVQTVTQPFFSTTDILQPGLNDFSVEAGRLRLGYAQVSNHYADAFASSTLRHGVTDNLTAELRGETSAAKSALGTTLFYKFWDLSVVNLTHVDTSSHLGHGALWGAGIQRTNQNFSFGCQSNWASAHYNLLGYNQSLPPIRQLTFYTGYSDIPYIGNLTFNYIHEKGNQFAEQGINPASDNRLLSLTASKAIGRKTFFYATVAKHTSSAFTASQGYQLSLSFSYAFDAADHVYASSRDQDMQVYYDHYAAKDDSLNYAVGAQRSADNQQAVNANLQWLSRRGSYGVQSNFSGADRNIAVTARGGVAYLDGQAELTKNISNGFALVEVPGMKDVDIYRDNGYYGKTNQHGHLFVHDLVPFYEHRVGIDENQIPIDMDMSSYDQKLITYPNAGYVVRFVPSTNKKILLKIVDEHHQVVEVGSQLIDDKGAKQIVGYNGEVQLNSIATGKNSFLINMKDNQSCRVEYVLNDSDVPSNTPIEVVCH